MKETELGKAVVQYLEENGWDVYQEVKHYQNIADIVAIKGYVCWVIECKAGSPFYAMEQALGWTIYANFVSIAIKGSRYGRRTRLLYLLSDFTGIGVLEFDDKVHEKFSPRLNRHVLKNYRLKDILHPGHKSFAKAGSKNEKRWSPWRQTCMGLEDYVKQNPGCRIREAVKNIPHHYSNDTCAKAALMSWIKGSKIEGIKRVREGKKIRLYPVNPASVGN